MKYFVMILFLVFLWSMFGVVGGGLYVGLVLRYHVDDVSKMFYCIPMILLGFAVLF